MIVVFWALLVLAWLVAVCGPTRFVLFILVPFLLVVQGLLILLRTQSLHLNTTELK
jgi:hypothetical protein